MATDKAFYELGRVAPNLIARLAGLDAPGAYRWTSPAVKALERRFDGVLIPTEKELPWLFAEFQGYPDRGFLRRWLQGIATYLAQNDYRGPIRALVLYVEAPSRLEEALDLRWAPEKGLLFRPESLILSEFSPE